MTLQDIIEFCSRRNQDITTLMSDDCTTKLSWNDLQRIQNQTKAAAKELTRLSSTLPKDSSFHTAYDIWSGDLMDILIRLEQVINIKREEEAVHIAAIQLHDQHDDYYLTAELETGFYSAASIYHNHMREDVGKLTLDSIARKFTDQLMINKVTFSILCEAMPYSEHLTELILFDFEHDSMSINLRDVNKMNTYALKDISAAVTRAEKKSGICGVLRSKIFEEILETIPECTIDENSEFVALAAKAEQVQPQLTLKTLLNTRWKNIHLMHRDVEIEVPHTIVELNGNTLTEAGRRAWQDVLDAKVIDIYDGYYGKQIELDYVAPKRLQDFSEMLAGYCSAEDYEKWVNEDNDTPDQECQPTQ